LDEEMKSKWRAMKGFLDDVIERPDDYPDKIVVFALTDDELCRIFTKERLRILRLLSEKQITSIKELSEYLKRDIAAVHRDLDILQRSGLVNLEKKGQRVRPSIAREGVYLSLVKPKPLIELSQEKKGGKIKI
jgi:predicted transcriptional regulator